MSRSRKKDEQTIALAGLFQAVALVDQIATRGMIPQSLLACSIGSLFSLSPDLTEDVYGGEQNISYNLELGFNSLKDTIEKKHSANQVQIMRYAISIIHLEKKLQNHQEYLANIGKGIEEAQRKALYFSTSISDISQKNQIATNNDLDISDEEIKTNNLNIYTHPNVLASLDQLYKETLSKFNFRIQVNGNPRYLQNSANAAKVRALLLAGVRSAMLWRQLGGQRWHLIFLKSQITPSVNHFLKT